MEKESLDADTELKLFQIFGAITQMLEIGFLEIGFLRYKTWSLPMIGFSWVGFSRKHAVGG